MNDELALRPGGRGVQLPAADTPATPGLVRVLRYAAREPSAAEVAAAPPVRGVDLMASDLLGWTAAIAESVPGASVRRVHRIGGGLAAQTFTIDTTDGAAWPDELPAPDIRGGQFRRAVMVRVVRSARG